MPLDRSLIASLPQFAGLDDDALSTVMREARSVRFPKDAAVFEQGAPSTSFFLLLHGHLRVFKLTPDGRQVVIRFVTPGELFGIAITMGHETYPATAAAVEDSVVLVWPNAAWESLARKVPALSAVMMKTIGKRLEDSHTRVVEMSTQQVERRVAHAVLRLAGRAGRKTDEGILIDLPLSRQDIAEMTGTTLYTVSRLISAWEAAGYVRAGRQKLLVVDAHGLFMLAEGREA